MQSSVLLVPMVSIHLSDSSGAGLFRIAQFKIVLRDW